MRKLLIVFVLLSSCTSASLQETNISISNNQSVESPKPPTKREEIIPNIPNTIWEKIFFRSIDERINEAKIETLRTTHLANDDIEARIWMGFGLTRLTGFTINRIKGNWSASYLTADYISKKSVNRNIKLDEPKSGWEKTWQKLIDSEILTLPDADSINCNAGALDGFSYVVELKKGNNYRTYMYENPALDFPNKCREANQMLNIIEIIFDEFSLKEKQIGNRI